jgi:hypothetical protein
LFTISDPETQNTNARKDCGRCGFRKREGTEQLKAHRRTGLRLKESWYMGKGIRLDFGCASLNSVSRLHWGTSSRGERRKLQGG